MRERLLGSGRASSATSLVILRLVATIGTGPRAKPEIAEVSQDLILMKGQPVADADAILVKSETLLRSDRFPRNREVGSADFLPSICVHPLTRGTNER